MPARTPGNTASRIITSHINEATEVITDLRSGALASRRDVYMVPLAIDFLLQVASASASENAVLPDHCANCESPHLTATPANAGGEQVLAQCTDCGFTDAGQGSNDLMLTKKDAHAEVPKRWRALPIADRRKYQQAIGSAERLAPTNEFDTLETPQNIIE